MGDRRLPSLPGSDENSLQGNSYDSFYKKRPSDIWQGTVEHTEMKEPEKCSHEFVETTDGVQCSKCYMGLFGKELVVKKGKVYFGKQQII